jgi:hypothetical protein
MFTQFQNNYDFYNNSYFKTIVDALPMSIMSNDQRTVFETLCNIYYKRLREVEQEEIREMGLLFRRKSADVIKGVAEICYYAFIYKIIFEFHNRDRAFNEFNNIIRDYVKPASKTIDFNSSREDASRYR